MRATNEKRRHPKAGAIVAALLDGKLEREQLHKKTHAFNDVRPPIRLHIGYLHPPTLPTCEHAPVLLRTVHAAA